MLFSATKTERAHAADRERMFEDALKRTHRQAYSFAYRLTGSATEAEDLVQETYLRAYRFFHRYDENLPFTAWLYRIMGNAHIDMVRRRGKLKTTSMDGGGDADRAWEFPDAETPETNLLQGAMDGPLQSAIEAMNPEFRTAVLLADVEGMAYEEVAVVMKTSVGTVRSRIHRGRKQLREHLRRHAPETYRSLAS